MWFYIKVALYCLALMLFVLYRSVTSKYRYENRKLFIYAQTCVCIFLVVDILWGLMDVQYVKVPAIFIKGIEVFWYILAAYTTYRSYVLIELMLDLKFIKSKKGRWIAKIPLILVIICAYLSSKEGWFFLAEEAKAYERGKWHQIQLLITYLYVLVPVAQILYRRCVKCNEINYDIDNSALMCCLYPVIFGYFQFVYKGSSYFDIGITLGMLNTHIFIQSRAYENARNLSKIQSLSKLFLSCHYVNIKTGMSEHIRNEIPEEFVEKGIVNQESKSINNEESVKKYVDLYVHEEHKNEFSKMASIEYMKEHLSLENPYYILLYRHKSGKRFKWYRLYVILSQTDKNGEPEFAVFATMDVDKEVRHEKRQRRIVEGALAQAEEANRAKTVFLSNMSHDIRTPMNAIIGFTTLARTKEDNMPQVQDYLKKIMASSNHLLSLINDVLDVSHIESGKLQLEEKPCNISEIMSDLRIMIQPLIEEKNIDFYFGSLNVEHENIYCDKLRLNQVLINLLSNAVKFTPKGGKVSINIQELKNNSESEATYVFTVADTGSGIGKEFLKNLFVPFERERNTTMSGIQGTGLGLAIAKSIVDMMGGIIEVQSEVGKGTEFIIQVDFRIHDVEAQEVPLQKLKDMHILVIDDDYDTCESVTKLLQQLDTRPEWTMHGKEAIHRMKGAKKENDPYEMVMVDWFMPDMPGLEVIRAIRNEMGNEIPIIVLTAYDWSNIEEDALKAGVTLFCSKPVFMSDLRRSLLQATEKEMPKQKEEPKKEVKIDGKRILVVEDNYLNREIAKGILENESVIVEVADDGDVAVEMVAAVNPGYYDLVLMDVQMPTMNGYEATKAIRQLENKELANIPIIAMTANAFEEDKEMARESGMNAHISKPIDIEKMLNTISEYL